MPLAYPVSRRIVRCCVGSSLVAVAACLLLSIGLKAQETAATVPTKAAAAVGADDWAMWRGPHGNNVAAGNQTVPTQWDNNTNVIWKAPVPGRGHASPTVVGDRIFLATADEQRQVQAVVALDRRTGKQLWLTPITRGGFPRIHRKNTHASSTVACDGQQLYVSFCHGDQIEVAALNLDGKIVWRRIIGSFQPRQYQYGYAASPTIYGDTLIVAADYDLGGYLTALKLDTGKVVWKTPRPRRLSYSSPIVARIAGKEQLLISGCDQVASYDPANGREIWKTAATTMATCGTMIWKDDLVFASGGYPKAETVCIKADGSGQVVWRNGQKCYEQSMLIHDEHVYAINDQGIALCWRAADGEERWRSRLPGGPVSASPVLANGLIYLSNERGTTYVFKADPDKFSPVAENQLGREAFATPTICGNRIYLRVADQVDGRRQEWLYAIGNDS